MANLKLQTGAGGLPAAPNALAGADLIILGQSGGLATTGTSYRGDLTAAKNFVLAGLTAASVVNVPAGNIAATNVQTAINELDSEKAGLALANIFTQPQIINTTSTTAAGYQFEIQSADPGASGVFIGAYHNSASPAASDNLGGMGFDGNNSAAARTFYAGFLAFINSPTAGAATGRLRFYAIVAGANLNVAEFSNGVTIGAPSGSFLGAGTLNAQSVVRTGQFTVATLPAAATVGAGARAYVTDALAPAFGVAVAGGGAVGMVVFSTGAAWNVG